MTPAQQTSNTDNPTEPHMATALELIAQVQGDAPALICGDVTQSWRAYENRAARICQALWDAGLTTDSKAGLYLHNGNEYLEAQFGIFKARACPINVNYRYVEDELVYLLNNADCEALFYQAAYADRVNNIRDRLPNITLYVCVDDASGKPNPGDISFEQLINSHPPAAAVERCGDDLYMLYTGGTTGMPKGVMYSQRQTTLSLMAGWTLLGGLEAPPTEMAEAASLSAARYQSGMQTRSLVTCPLMHGTGMWVGAMIPQLMGGVVITSPADGFDPGGLWRIAQDQKATFMVIVGDAFAKPLLDALDTQLASGSPYDLSHLQAMMSSGVMWSSEVKQGLLRHHPMALVDAMGSSEGSMGSSVTTRESAPQTAKFELGNDVKVFTEDDEEVVAGSGTMGMIGTPGNVPLGYYKDPEKSAVTFREINGVRYSFPGDYATIEADGSITLLGRGSKCINTAGEKVFPEEVEEAVKRNDCITDCLVVGLPDERFGQRIVAVASREAGANISETQLIDATRAHLAGYKLPRQVVFTDTVQRAPNGKADYKWAEQTAKRLAL